VGFAITVENLIAFTVKEENLRTSELTYGSKPAFLNKAPDYLMDSVPHNDRFWQGWFSR
jgi:hypothetical protein